jgi:predicted nucleotidyltransferase
MKRDKVQILKCLVGSRAHGLHNEDSDYDYRAVYVNATTEILRIGHTYKGNHWVEGEKEDQTA